MLYVRWLRNAYTLWVVGLCGTKTAVLILPFFFFLFSFPLFFILLSLPKRYKEDRKKDEVQVITTTGSASGPRSEVQTITTTATEQSEVQRIETNGTNPSYGRRVGRVVNAGGPDYVPFFHLTWGGKTTRKIYYDAAPTHLEKVIEEDLRPTAYPAGALQVSVTRTQSSICPYDANTGWCKDAFAWDVTFVSEQVN